MDISVDISGLTALQVKFVNLQLKSRDWRSELFDIGILLLRSVDLNFRDQGRPTRWKQSKAAQERNGMTLVDTGRLRRSTTVYGNEDNIFSLTPDHLQLSTDVEYAKYLQEDRPFLMIQEEDIKNMEKIINRTIERIL